MALAPAPAGRVVENEDGAPVKDFDAYQEAQETRCVGPADGRQASPGSYEVGSYRYLVDGAFARVWRTSPRANPAQFRLGLVGAIKDETVETKANLAEYLGKFKSQDVDAIVVLGDTAFMETEVEEILGLLAESGLPVLAIIGNMESRSGWNRALRAAHASHRNVLNLDFVRVADLGPVQLVSLPGYYDKRFTHQSSSCVYEDDDTRGIAKLAAGLPGPVVLVSHGPPKQSGKLALDYVPEAGNVGDERMTDAIAAAKIPFGVFDHVLESGGRATDLSGKKEIRPLTPAEALYVNAGSGNSLPWRMNVGPESYGMAVVLTVEGKKAKYEVFRSPRRIAVGE